MKPPLSICIFGDQVITIPSYVVPRWNQCMLADSLVMWRSFAFLLSAEAKMSQVEGDKEMESDLKFLFELAMQHVYSLQPSMEEA